MNIVEKMPVAEKAACYIGRNRKWMLEDLKAEAYLALCETAEKVPPGLEDGKELDDFLFVCIFRKLINFVHREQKQATISEGELGRTGEGVAGLVPAVQSEAAFNQEIDELKEELSKSVDPLVLHYMGEGLNTYELAKKCGLSQTSVHRKMRQGQEALAV